ncbi:hypothetical protein V8C26DRAFT_407234 [Trichoderma gracile]
MNKDEHTSPQPSSCAASHSCFFPPAQAKAADSLMIHSKLPKNASRPFLSQTVVCLCLFFLPF